jgi:uncharacterized membrane protein
MPFEKLKTHKKAIILSGILLISVSLTWVFLADSQPGWYGKLFSIGSSVCHQIPSHSFISASIQFPVCARCAGLYLGSFIGLVYAFSSGRKRGIPKTGYLILLASFFILWAGDGANSFISDFLNRPFLYETTNPTRLATGYGMGLVMSTALATLFNNAIWSDGEKTALLNRIDQVLGYAAVCAIFSLFLFTNQTMLFLAAGLIVIVSILSTISLLYTIFWVIALRRENKFNECKDLRVFLLAGYTTAIGQVILMITLRNMLL